MLSLLLDDGVDDNRMVDGTGFHTLDALERSADALLAGGMSPGLGCFLAAQVTWLS